MSNIKYALKDIEKTHKNSQFSESGIFVKEDDQDWGSSGIYDMQVRADVE
tara:strand:+ start:82 stop:231 length:150 start_codon:yes stop_codon:yes gene_type:complete